jgi:hypothetical protein
MFLNGMEVSMKGISILHLSDIHFRKREKTGLISYQKNVQEKMLKSIGEHSKKHGVPDFVVIMGDISYDGRDYSRAELFFDKLKMKMPGTGAKQKHYYTVIYSSFCFGSSVSSEAPTEGELSHFASPLAVGFQLVVEGGAI